MQFYALAVLLMLAAAQPAPAADSPIVERVVVGPWRTNCYVVADRIGGEGVIIDPGEETPAILEQVEKLRIKVRYIINTHGHIDHIAANGPLRKALGAALLIHKADAEWLNQPVHDGFYSTGKGKASPDADRYIRGGEEIRAGKLCLKVIETPGHTAGGICLLMGRRLFSGDTLFRQTVGRTDQKGGSLAVLLRSIRERLLPLPDDTILLPGHGEAGTVGEERKTNPYLVLPEGKAP